MVIDSVSIVAMHTMEGDMKRHPADQRRGYIRELLEGSDGDLYVLPGDSDDVKTTVVIGFEQLMVAGLRSIILYKSNKMRLTKRNLNRSNFPSSRIDFQQMIVVDVEIMSPQPIQTVVKKFLLVTWEDAMLTRETTDAGRKSQTEDLIRLCQHLAASFDTPVFVAGDFRQPVNVVMKILNQLNTQMVSDTEDNEGVSSFYDEMGFLPSMKHGNMRSLRHKYKLTLHSCIRATHTEHSPLFLASKELELTQASWLDLEVATGKKVQMEALKDQYRPMKTQMNIPARPPKFIGG